MIRIQDIAGACLLGSALALMLAVPFRSARADTVLYNFCSEENCADGANPENGLIADSAGNLYGTTAAGGANTGGTVYEFSGGGESVLYSFVPFGSDGWAPLGVLIRDKQGNLYGTTQFGGGTGCGGNGCGTVFEISGGAETQLHVFAGGSDGAWPTGALVRDKKGNFYGTTPKGGSTNCGGGGCGTIFELTPTGKEKVLHAFIAQTDGQNPVAGLVLKKGYLYGTALYGGTYGEGTVYKLDLKTGALNVLYSFTGGSDGGAPEDTLAWYKGAFYGTADIGGSGDCGTVFKITRKGKLTTLYSFTGANGDGDGCSPVAGLTLYQGNFYGTTQHGGDACGNYTCGTVFEISPEGSESVLWQFESNDIDGAEPFGGVIASGGTLYGTTDDAGENQYGVIFSVAP